MRGVYLTSRKRKEISTDWENGYLVGAGLMVSNGHLAGMEIQGHLLVLLHPMPVADTVNRCCLL